MWIVRVVVMEGMERAVEGMEGAVEAMEGMEEGMEEVAVEETGQ